MFSLSPTVNSTLVLTGILDGNKRDERETFSSQLKNFRDNLTAKTGLWDELKESYSELRGTIYNLTQKMSQLEKDEDLLTAMTDNLTSEVVKMRDELQAKGKCSRNKLPALHYFDCVKLKKWRSGISGYFLNIHRCGWRHTVYCVSSNRGKTVSSRLDKLWQELLLHLHLREKLAWERRDLST